MSALLLVASVGTLIWFAWVRLPRPVFPPEEWTLLAVAAPDEGTDGWEQAAQVFQGTRDGVFFLRAVWNASRQNLQGIFWQDSYRRTFSGTEGLVEINGCYVEDRYVYALMTSSSEEHEIVIAQRPQTPAEVLFVYNAKWVYKTGDDYTATVGFIPLTSQGQPIDIQELHIYSVETACRSTSGFEFYLSGNIPPTISQPTMDGVAEDWQNLTKFEVAVSNIDPPVLFHCARLSMTRFNTELAAMFSLGGNYSSALQRFPHADLQTLSQLLFYRGPASDYASYSLYLHADRTNGTLETTGDYLHVWDENDQTYFQRTALPIMDFAVNTTFEALLPASVWGDLMNGSGQRVEISPDVTLAYSWKMQLV